MWFFLNWIYWYSYIHQRFVIQGGCNRSVTQSICLNRWQKACIQQCPAVNKVKIPELLLYTVVQSQQTMAHRPNLASKLFL